MFLRSSATILLTHGAGSNTRSPLLRSLEASFSAAGLRVVLHDLAFRRIRSSGPPRPGDGPKDRADLQAVLQELRGPGPLYAGGVSYGGRMLSMVASEDATLCDALLLLAYPLHPRAKRDQLRTAHLPALRTPALFAHGSRDPLGSVAEMAAALALVGGRSRLYLVDKAGHNLRGLAPDGLVREFLEFVSG